MIDKQKKITYVHWALLFGLFVYAYTATFNVKLDIGGDNAFYIIFAKSILAGKGYASPMTPDYAPTGHFPPGYSAILAFFMMFTGDNYLLLKILNGLFLLASILILYKLMWKLTGNAPFAFSVAALMLLNKHLYMYATILMSEMPYLFFTTLTLLMAWQLTESGKAFWKSWHFYLMVLAMAMTYYLRAVGITVVLAIFIHFLLQKKWGLALSSFAGFVLLYLPWVIRNSMHGIESRYLGTVMTVNPWRPEEGTISTFGEFFSKMVDNFQETVIKGFPDVLFPFLKINFREPASVLLVIGGVLVLGLVLYGLWNLGKYRYLFLLYILGNIGIFLIWHGGNASRYVAPVTPFIAFGFYYGVLGVLDRMKIINLVKQKNWAYSLLILVFFMISPLKELAAASKRPYPPGL